MSANPNRLPVSEAARKVFRSLPDYLRLQWTHTLLRAFVRFEQSKDAAFVAMLEGMKRDATNNAVEQLRNAVIDEAIANAKALGEGRE